MTRPFAGIKNRLAMEFTGYTGTQSQFLYAYRRGQPTPAAKHHHYTPWQVRNIRLDLAGQVEAQPRPRQLPPLINCRMAKGGVGKTTVSGNTAACLAMMGYRTLLIDGDPQASLSTMFGVDWTRQEVTHIGTLMQRLVRKEPTQIAAAAVPIYAGGMLDLIPASIELADADTWLTATMGRERTFEKLLQAESEFFSRYDAIVIDSAPGTTQLTIALMVAAQTMLAVVTPEAKAIGALPSLESNLQELNDNFPGRGYKAHIVVNRYNQGRQPHQANLAKLLGTYGPIVDDCVIRDFVGFLREDSDEEAHGPVLEHEPNSVGARDVIDLTKSLIALYGIKLGGVPAATEAAA